MGLYSILYFLYKCVLTALINWILLVPDSNHDTGLSVPNTRKCAHVYYMCGTHIIYVWYVTFVTDIPVIRMYNTLIHTCNTDVYTGV